MSGLLSFFKLDFKREWVIVQRYSRCPPLQKSWRLLVQAVEWVWLANLDEVVRRQLAKSLLHLETAPMSCSEFGVKSRCT